MEHSTCAKNAQVRIEGQRKIVREIPYYNLDMIISIGYRVNSKNATSFRQWTTSVLRQYLIKGYAINQQIKLDRYNELKNVVRLMSRAIDLQDDVTTDEYGGLFNVISDYVYALDTLDQYDYQSLSIQKTTKEEPFRATYENAMEAINALKKKFGGSQLFANISNLAKQGAWRRNRWKPLALACGYVHPISLGRPLHHFTAGQGQQFPLVASAMRLSVVVIMLIVTKPCYKEL